MVRINVREASTQNAGFFLCAEQGRQLGGENPLPNLMEVKG
jgi:hypothetical protein